MLSSCEAPTVPTETSPLRLPTRIPATATPTPIGPQVYHEAGLDYRAAGLVDEAIEAFDRALEADPEFAPAYLERAIIYLLRDDPDAALADIQASIHADPENATAHALLAELLRQEFDDPLQALSAYEMAVRLDPALAPITFQGRWQCAVESAQADRMLNLSSEYVNAHPDDPLKSYYRALAFGAAGSSSSALDMLSEALEEEDVAALWLALGDAYAELGSWDHAATCYEQARSLTEGGDDSIALISDNPPATLSRSLGTAYVYIGRCSDARNLLNHAAAVGQEWPEYHTLLGRAMICLTPTPTPTPYPWLNQ
jgi:tetratricopeptide (TPR) repeat protein